MKTTTFILLIAVVSSACASAVTPIPPTAIPTQTLAPTPSPLPPTSNPKLLAAELDAVLQKSNRAGTFDGSVLVARNGQVILSQGYGFADRSKQTPNTAQTKFLIGSITKQFTAMAILLLQAQGKLNVQDKLCAYVPNCPEIFKPVTLYHLLTMSSGIPNSTRWDLPGDRMLSKVATLYAQPGEKWLYADVGFNLLGKVIETVSGQTYEVFMQKHIFEPLQMSSTGYYHQEKDLAKGYSSSQDDTALQNSDYFAAGALYSTVEDLYRYDQALAAGTLLPVPALSAMFTAYMPIPAGLVIHGEQGWGYGYGWFIGPDKPRRIYYDGGQPVGFRAAIWRYPDDQATIIQLCNHEGVMIVPAALAIAEKMFGE